MSNQRRDEEKRRRRQKRQAKKNKGPGRAEMSDRVRDSIAILKQIENAAPPPARWPGSCDPSVDRPDLVKVDLARYAIDTSPKREKLKQLIHGLQNGLVGFLPELDHWAIEEYLWHGVPGDPWHPVDAFLAKEGDRFPPAAAAQLRLWKQARLGIFEIGEVADDKVLLREYDAERQTVSATPVPAVALNIGGAAHFRNQRGKMTLIYLAPWVPEEGLFCSMGYGVSVPPALVNLQVPFLGLRQPELVCRPLPWNQNPAAAQKYLREWRRREWQGWLEERLTTPFLALVSGRPDEPPMLRRVHRLLPATAEQAREMGIYFDVEYRLDEGLIAGATNITPLDVASANRLALAEYHAYRKLSGPPPGMAGKPAFTRFGPR